jgi:hypothetical protein
MFGLCETDLALGACEGHSAPSGLGVFMGTFYPGRCPGLSHCAPLGRKTGVSGLFVFNPNGVTGESPGQRPGFANELDTQALKGRYEDARGMR